MSRRIIENHPVVLRAIVVGVWVGSRPHRHPLGRVISFSSLPDSLSLAHRSFCLCFFFIAAARQSVGTSNVSRTKSRTRRRMSEADSLPPKHSSSSSSSGSSGGMPPKPNSRPRSRAAAESVLPRPRGPQSRTGGRPSREALELVEVSPSLVSQMFVSDVSSAFPVLHPPSSRSLSLSLSLRSGASFFSQGTSSLHRSEHRLSPAPDAAPVFLRTESFPVDG